MKETRNPRPSVDRVEMADWCEALRAFDGIRFREDDHTYSFADGSPATSATTWLKQFVKPFDEQYWAEKKARERGVDKEQVLMEWDQKRRASSGKGTATHLWIEQELLGNVAPEPIPALMMHARNALADLREHFVPLRPEWVVGCPEWGICGQVDLVAINRETGRLHIFDWKTNDELSMRSKYFHTGGMASVPDSKWHHYSLQLSLYAAMIERMTGIRAGGLHLVWMSEMQPDYMLVDCVDYRELVQKVLTGR